MVNVKTLTSVQSLLLFSRCVFGQQPTPNASLFIPIPDPTEAGSALHPGEVIQASEITVSASSTIFEIIDSNTLFDTADTFTLALSPSGASVHAVDIAKNDEQVLNDTCVINGDTAVCQLVVVEKANNVTGTVTIPSTATFTEKVTPKPVVAVNFKTSPTLKAPPPNSAAMTRVSIAFIALVTFGLAFRRLV